ncbi:23_t:CDS:2 [Dentiscutata heterogama]|uniref:23_t:CDS:1 n=1 Tax=Dentiscutata heterogama TaxID=1316150 RepID=A0ACA9KTG9_9GLOM|nr:23_t:CDS:2 [Dentiscutata heterogama]
MANTKANETDNQNMAIDDVEVKSNANKPVNPWKLITSLERYQAMTFIATFLGWTLDAFDFFTVSFALPYIAAEFQMKPSDIATSIIVTLLLRPVCALIFGILADKYGRKYPLMADIILYSVVELASGFAPNFQVFVALRAIFGIAMGGEWGLGAALAMEALPPECRYPTGYLIAAIFYYAVIKTLGWRAMFWIGTQDLFPTFLKTQLLFSPAGAFLPLIAIPVNKSLVTFGAFAVYFFVQGAYGILPAHLNELLPPRYRGTFPGLTYHLGALIASSSAQIEASLGEAFPKGGVPDYGLVVAVMSACAMVVVIIFISTGGEQKHLNFMEEAEISLEEDIEVVDSKNVQ